MFEHALLDSACRAPVHSGIHYLFATLADAVLVGLLALIPMVYTQALPKQLLPPPVHIAPPAGPPPASPAVRAIASAHRPTVNLLVAPVRIPPVIVHLVEAPEPPSTQPAIGVIGAGPGGSPDGVLNGVIGSPFGTMQAPPPPPPRPSIHQTSTAPMLRVGGDVIAARAVYRPAPEYPPLAKMAHVQGTVKLEAIIASDGAIMHLKVISGHPLLVSAALDAVKMWRYQPTLLNREPVEVQTEIDVNFRLEE